MPNFKRLKVIYIKKYSSLCNSFAILLAGLIITFSASKYVNHEDEIQSQKDFALTCNEIKAKISLRINLHLQFLNNASSFFKASELVTRKEWEEFNKFSTMNENFTGVQGFGFSSIIKKDQLEQHKKEIRTEGFETYEVYPFGERNQYSSIIYIEPYNTENSRIIGYDMLSNSIMRKAMEYSRDHNTYVLSSKVDLGKITKSSDKAETIMYVPVYKNEPLNTMADRRAAIIGWVFSPFRMDELMKSIIGSWTGGEFISLQIYDDQIISSNNLLFDSATNNADIKVQTQTLPISFNNKKWSLVFSQPLLSSFLFSPKTLIIAIGGTIISLLLFALSYSLFLTKQRAKIIAQRLSLNLSIKNQEYEMVNNTLQKNYKKLISSKEKLKETNNQLQKAKVKAEESDQLKSAFLANMSHEIRTPMNGIMGFTELLKEANLSSEEKKDYIEIIEKSGNRLLTIINDIVDISKIEAGQMNVSLCDTNLEEQLQYIQTFFMPETKDRDLVLVLKKSLTDEKTIIKTDREKLYAILINLVKNAIKYTPKGIIEFGYEKKQNHIEFFVKDTGIGISKDRHEAIFERFIQADYNDKMARQGAGLGLSIAKAYVELLGGKIWVESEPEKGSTFYFTLPNGVSGDENKAVVKNTFADKIECQVDKLKIIIAEDDKISRILISKVLDSFSKEILIAKNGLEAVQIFQENPDVDLILMDMQMPQMNGYEATKKIRKVNKEVIIVAQTAFALEGDKEKTIKVGCNDYLSKPIKREELSRLIQHYFCDKPKLG